MRNLNRPCGQSLRGLAGFLLKPEPRGRGEPGRGLVGGAPCAPRRPGSGGPGAVEPGKLAASRGLDPGSRRSLAAAGEAAGGHGATQSEAGSSREPRGAGGASTRGCWRTRMQTTHFPRAHVGTRVPCPTCQAEPVGQARARTSWNHGEARGLQQAADCCCAPFPSPSCCVFPTRRPTPLPQKVLFLVV